MTTTSLKLPVELKERANFVADAEAARADMFASGKGYDADEVHAWLNARLADRKAAKPKAKSWRV